MNLNQLNNIRLEYVCARSALYEVIKRLELNRKSLEKGNTECVDLYIDDLYVNACNGFRTIATILEMHDDITLLNVCAKYRGIMSVIEYYRMNPLSMTLRLKEIFRVLDTLKNDLEYVVKKLSLSLRAA